MQKALDVRMILMTLVMLVVLTYSNPIPPPTADCGPNQDTSKGGKKVYS